MLSEQCLEPEDVLHILQAFLQEYLPEYQVIDGKGLGGKS